MRSSKRAREDAFVSRAFAVLMALVLCVGYIPFVPTIAYADTLVGGELLGATAEPGGTVSGGDTISENGTYTLADEATGTIEVGEGLKVTIVGKSWDAEKNAFNDTSYKGLNIKVGNDTALTIKDVHADQGGDASSIDFSGDGTLIIEGNNLIDNDGGLNAAVVHVGLGSEVHFAGTGTLYGYKSALCSYIGGNNGEANGKIVFDGGYWFLKGTKTGAVIGGDSTSDKGGDIVINGGELYVKGVARGALIGGSNQGKSSDVYVNGGLVELFEDFSGPAIGAGNAANAGNLYVTGGSLKTTLSSNSANAYGQAAEFGGMPAVAWTAVKALNANDFALLAFDASSYISDLSSDTVVVNVDDKPFYSGRAYTYVTNEVKNPNDITGTTMDNWLSNDASWLVTQEDYGASAYPSKNGSSLVPEKNLYFALSKTDHVITVGDDSYSYKWNEENGAFELQGDEPPAPGDGYKWYLTPASENVYEIGTADELAELATVANGTVPEGYSIEKDDFAGKTVTLRSDIDLSAIEDWAPIANSYENAFKGTFDGNGRAITGLTVVGGGENYQGLFGCNDGIIKNFSIAGTITGTSGDYYGAVAGFNFGTIEDVTSSVDITASGVYNMGGIAGFNTSGLWVIADSNRNNVVQPTFDDAVGLVQRCGWTGQTLTAANKVGGIVGENAGTVCECFSGAGTISAPGSQKGGAGGIVGRNGCNNNADETGFVDSCYSFATVGSSGDRWFGGIVGFQNNTYGFLGKTPVSSTSNCYFAGTLVSGYSSNWGPIVGNSDGGNIPDIGSNNYSLEGISSGGTSEIQQGIVKTADEMKTDAFCIALRGEGEAFNMDSENVNGGFPVLAWQGGTAPAEPVVSYAASIDQGIENGTVALTAPEDKTLDALAEGDAVTVTATPAEGYEIASVFYTPEGGEAVVIEPASDEYVFQMPAANVVVSATFEEIPVPGDGYKWYLTPAGENTYEIGTADELAELATIVNGTVPRAYSIAPDDFAGKTVTLTADIDLSGIADWTPIGDSSKAFAGTFDGAGKTISGLSITTGGGYKGLFGNNAGTVKDFTIAGSIGAEGAYVGGNDFYGVVALNTGTVSGVVSTLSIYPGASDTYAVGGVVGKNQGGTVVQCGFAGVISADISKSVYRTGGVVGFQSAGSISECYNTATVSAWNYRNGDQGTGGVLGSMEGGTVSYCYNTANVYNGDGSSSAGGKQGAGGIVGAIADGSVDHCYSTGSAFGPGSAGVIIGKLGNGTYSDLYSLYTARSWQQYGTQTDPETGLKYCDGADENADGSLKFGGAALANSYNSGYTIVNSWTKSADEMKAAAFCLALRGEGEAFNMDSEGINGGYPVLAWQGGTPVTEDDVAAIQAVVDAVAAIGEEVTVDSKEAVEAAQAAYEALTEDQKAMLPAQVQDAYDNALASYAGALVEAIPSDATTEAGIAAVNEAVTAYNALSDDQKALVPAASVATLVRAQQAAANALVEEANAKANEAEKAREDAEAAAAAAQAAAAAAQAEAATAQAAATAAQAEAATAKAAATAAQAEAATAKAEATASKEEAAAAQAQVTQLKKDLETAQAAQGLKANPMTVTAKAANAKAGKKTVIKKAKAFSVQNAKGKVTFAKMSGNAKITVSKAGKVKVKKGLKKGKTFKVKVLVCAAGDSSYAPAVKTVTLKVKVK